MWLWLIMVVFVLVLCCSVEVIFIGWMLLWKVLVNVLLIVCLRFFLKLLSSFIGFFWYVGW